MITKHFFTRTFTVALAGVLALGCATCIDARDEVSASANTDVNADKWLALSQKGYSFDVFRRWDDRPQHEKALLAVAQTDRDGKQFGLMFMQTREEGHRGLGMLCPKVDRLAKTEANGSVADDAFRCHQHIGAKIETLTVGLIDSKFCADLRDTEDKDKNLTTDGKNPIATPEECATEYPDGDCVCYQIKIRTDPDLYSGASDPPTDGSGSGGRKGGG